MEQQTKSRVYYSTVEKEIASSGSGSLTQSGTKVWLYSLMTNIPKYPGLEVLGHSMRDFQRVNGFEVYFQSRIDQTEDFGTSSYILR